MSNKQQWIVKKALFDKTFLNRLQQQTNLSLPVLQYLTNRGYLTKEAIGEIKNPENKGNFLDYLDSEKLLTSVIANKSNNILVYSDFDCDGICAAAIATYGLRKLGFTVLNYFNSRFDQGYGFQQAGIDYALAGNCPLIICLDQGISDLTAAQSAGQQGLQLVIIDHHQALTELPQAEAVVDPCRPDEKEYEVLFSGAALSFQFVQALAERLNDDSDFLELLPLVALSTLSDVMELKGTNRYYVKTALAGSAEPVLPAFQVFAQQKSNQLNADDFRFILAPQINAVGRLSDDVKPALNFFLSPDYQTAKDYYELIKALNQQRQALTKVQLAKALAQVDDQDKVNVVVGDFHEGLVGLLASRITAATNKLTLILSEKADGYVGSLRSPRGGKLPELLQKLSASLEKFGGHDLAAGLFVKQEKLTEFITLFRQLAPELSEPEAVYLDYVYQTRYLRDEDIESWEELAPFGPAFEYPNLGLLVENYEYFLLKDTHLKLVTPAITIMAFNCAKFLPVVQSGLPLKVLVKFERDRNGQYQAVLVQEDIRLLNE